MSALSSISSLADASRYDRCMCKEKSARYPFIYEAKTPKGKCALLKTLVSNHCKGDCRYCVNSKGAGFGRKRLDESELADFFMLLRKRGLVQGAFLSSGIDRDADFSMQRIIGAGESIRQRGFKGYIHLKIIPGASKEMVKRAVEIADRVSINLEAPKKSFLNELSSQKDFNIDIIRRMRWASKMVKNSYTDLTTQFIVGAADENDKEIMRTTKRLYERYSVKRAFFSGFNPIRGTPLESREKEDSRREFRLYQSDWLLRVYNYKFKEFVFEEGGNLDLGMDPKYKIALDNREIFPINPDRAGYNELIRVPGIGPTSANRILHYRKNGEVNKKMLNRAGAATKRALPFLAIQCEYQQTLGNFGKV